MSNNPKANPPNANGGETPFFRKLEKGGFLSVRDISILTGKSRATLWRWVNENRFPAPTKIGPNSIAWRVSAYLDWEFDPAGWAERPKNSA